jgi:hypothetical protein
MNTQSKIESILEQLSTDSFLAEDHQSMDYCKYCSAIYGNYLKRGCDKRSTQENHEPDCLHRLAVEVLEERIV